MKFTYKDLVKINDPDGFYHEHTGIVIGWEKQRDNSIAYKVVFEGVLGKYQTAWIYERGLEKINKEK